GVTIVARGRTGSREAAAALVRTLTDLDPLVPPDSVTTMRDRLALPLWPPRVAATLFPVCGTVGVVAVGPGFLGIAYYALLRRQREFGLRLALGARPSAIRGLVIREALWSIVPGACVGLVLAWAAASIGRAAFVGVSVVDVRVYAMAAIVIGAVA